MLWNTIWAALGALCQLVNAWLGYKVNNSQISPTQRRIYDGLFIVFGIVGIFAVGLIAYRSTKQERIHFDGSIGWAYSPNPLPVDKPLTIEVWVKPAGVGAAKNSATYSHAFIEQDFSLVSENEAVSEYYKLLKVMFKDKPQHGSTIVSGTTKSSLALGQILSPEDISNLKFGRRVIIVVSDTFFEDDFGKHTQQLCRVLMPIENNFKLPMACEIHTEELSGWVLSN